MFGPVTCKCFGNAITFVGSCEIMGKDAKKLLRDQMKSTENKKAQTSEIPEANFKFGFGFWKPKDIWRHFRSLEYLFSFFSLLLLEQPGFSDKQLEIIQLEIMAIREHTQKKPQSTRTDEYLFMMSSWPRQICVGFLFSFVQIQIIINTTNKLGSLEQAEILWKTVLVSLQLQEKMPESWA